MKKPLLTSVPAILFLLFAFHAPAQSTIPDQNPDFATSREKYMKMADSVNQWHSTTTQQTYKAFDRYESRMARRAGNRQYRRDLRQNRHRYYYQPYRNFHSGYGNRYYHRPYSPWRYWWW